MTVMAITKSAIYWQPMSKVPQGIADIACNTGILPPRARGEVAVELRSDQHPEAPSMCIMDRGSNRCAAAHRYPMHDMRSVPTAATLHGPAPPIIPADR